MTRRASYAHDKSLPLWGEAWSRTYLRHCRRARTCRDNILHILWIVNGFLQRRCNEPCRSPLTNLS